MDARANELIIEPSGNRLLATLPPQAVASLGNELEAVELAYRLHVSKPHEPVQHVYFPVRGVMSMVAHAEEGGIVEFATAGREGFVGLPVLLGTESMATETFVQVPGAGFRIKSRVFTSFLDQQPQFRALLMRYTMALLMQVAQGASCNRLHEVDARCARWLLHTDDRVDGHEFPLTQEFLAQMLGVHRPTVSIAAGMLQSAGFISYKRGIIKVVDRAGLESAACPCYRFIVDEYERLLGTRG